MAVNVSAKGSAKTSAKGSDRGGAKRLRIAPRWVVASMAVGVVGVLFAAHPRESIQRRLIAEQVPSELSIAYLEALLRSSPNDSALLGFLGSQYVKLGRDQDARLLADRLAASSDDTVRRQGVLLRLDIDSRAAIALSDTDPAQAAARASRLAGVRVELARIASMSWDDAERQRLATLAGSMGAPELAAALYRQLFQDDPAHADDWGQQWVRFATYAGDYQSAADGWFALQQHSENRDEQRRYFLSGLRALQSGNQLDAALRAADRYGGAFQQDRQVLFVLLKLARAAHAVDRVDRYAKALAGYAMVVPPESVSPHYADAAALTVASVPVRTLPVAAKVLQVPAAVYARLGWGKPAGFDYLDGSQPARTNHYRGHGGYRQAALSSHQQIGRIIRVALDVNTSAAQATAATPAAAAAEGSAEGSAEGEPSRDETAALLYQSFLESSDLQNAQRLAAEQVARAPDSTVWMARLARVAEWNNAPQLALQMWLNVAQKSNDGQAWGNVLRLAPMLNDDNAYLLAITHASQSRPGDSQLLDAMIATYERLGRPNDALAYLRQHGADPSSKAFVNASTAPLIERYAALSERAGNDDEALRAYRLLATANPGNRTYALRVANLLYRHNDIKGALDVLLAARAGSGPSTGQAAATAATDDVLYWRTVAELARLQQRDDISNEAYRQLLATRRVGATDLAAMTFFYDPFPIDAARTAEAQYRIDHSSRALQEAVHYYTDARALDAVATLLREIAPEQLATLEQDPNFLRVRAEYERQAEQPDAALKDLDKAVSLPGATLDIRVAWLWTLVDYGSDQQLRQAVAQWPDGVEGTPALWGPMAAALTRLNRPEAALRYLRLQSATMARDPLWLMAYAEALEMAGHEDLAWSTRRAVWRSMQQSVTSDDAGADGRGAGRAASRVAQDAEAAEQTAGRRVTLATLFENVEVSRVLLDDLILRDAGRRDMQSTPPATQLGDSPGLTRLRALMQSEKSAQARLGDDRLRSSVAKDVALAWALSHEGNALARRWLARQYASTLAAPSEQVMAIALADNDRDTIAKLLDSPKGRLPVNSAIDAAVALDRPGQAQQLAFDASAGAPNSDILHGRLLDTTTTWPQSVSAGVVSNVQHPLDSVTIGTAGSVKIGDHFMVGAESAQRLQRSSDNTQLQNVPRLDSTVDVFLRRQSQDTAFMAKLGERHGMSTVYPMSLAAEMNRRGALSATISVGRDQAANESQALAVGGVKDNVVVGARLAMTQRLYASGTFEADRFYSQSRNMVGSGTQLAGELGFKIRTNYPDYTVRVIGVRGNYHASGQPDGLMSRLIPTDDAPVTAASVMPQSYAQYGLFFGFGNDTRTEYSRAWRPFLDLGIVHDSNQGWGPQVTAGVGGSVFGGDRATVFISRQQVSGVGTAVTLMGVNYTYFY